MTGPMKTALTVIVLMICGVVAVAIEMLKDVGKLWLAFGIAVLFILVLLFWPAHAHDHNHPELNDWYKSLHSKAGTWCCDEKDAQTAEDWDTDNGHYRVRIDGDWISVPDGAIVDSPNRAQVAKVWYYRVNGEPSVRCFMPGSMT